MTARSFAAGASASVDQNRIVVSRLHVTAKNGRSGCVAIAYTSARWQSDTVKHAPTTTSHVRTVASHEPVKHTFGISGCHACPRTYLVCPRKTIAGSVGAPVAPSSDHTRAVVSSDTDSRRPGTSGEYVTP